MYKLTFDTSVRINASKDPSKEIDPKLIAQFLAANKLREAHENGLIEITYNFGEPPNAHEKTNFSTTQGPWMLGIAGYSELGVSTFLPDQETLLVEVECILNPIGENSRKDFANLAEHIMAGRDIFVSEDIKKHLNKAKALKQYGIRVMSATDAVKFLKDEGVI